MESHGKHVILFPYDKLCGGYLLEGSRLVSFGLVYKEVFCDLNTHLFPL
jgi:hypothetical protein